MICISKINDRMTRRGQITRPVMVFEPANKGPFGTILLPVCGSEVLVLVFTNGC